MVDIRISNWVLTCSGTIFLLMTSGLGLGLAMLGYQPFGFGKKTSIPRITNCCSLPTDSLNRRPSQVCIYHKILLTGVNVNLVR